MSEFWSARVAKPTDVRCCELGLALRKSGLTSRQVHTNWAQDEFRIASFESVYPHTTLQERLNKVMTELQQTATGSSSVKNSRPIAIITRSGFQDERSKPRNSPRN